MLTRLKVNGFKNLVDVDIRFGPFTCIAGANGVGKSNLFDAIRFLSALADLPLIEAATSVRGGKTADIRSLFHRVGDDSDRVMRFEAEMIVPSEGTDDLGQTVVATTTFLRYVLELGLRDDASYSSLGGLELRREELTHIKLGEAARHLRFPHSPNWRNSVVLGRRTTPFISTVPQPDGKVVIQRHMDSGSGSGGGRPAPNPAGTFPRTVLSVANGSENRTAVLARREMQSWRLLQLEPTALREPDSFSAPPRLGVDGSHLAATIYRLAHSGGPDADLGTYEAHVYASLANRLTELIDDVREVSVDRDERRELLTVQVEGKDGTTHPARSLSDGTLRFLALGAIDLDPLGQGVLCLEEPENGIHPARIPAMIQLLQDIAVDPQLPVGPDNPLRQVIINTHSPAVVAQVPDDSLVVAESKEDVRENRAFQRVSFGYLPDTWRARADENDDLLNVVAKGRLLAYLNPLAMGMIEPTASNGHMNGHSRRKITRVMDRSDLQLALPYLDSAFSSRK